MELEILKELEMKPAELQHIVRIQLHEHDDVSSDILHDVRMPLKIGINSISSIDF